MAIFHFPQYEGEPFGVYFARFQDYLSSCGGRFTTCDILGAIYEGLNEDTWTYIESKVIGGFCSLPEDIAWSFLVDLARFNDPFTCDGTLDYSYGLNEKLRTSHDDRKDFYGSPPQFSCYFCSYCHSHDHEYNSCPYIHIESSPQHFSSLHTSFVPDFYPDRSHETYGGETYSSYVPEMEHTHYSSSDGGEGRLASDFGETMKSPFRDTSKEVPKTAKTLGEMIESARIRDTSLMTFDQSPPHDNLRNVSETSSFEFESHKTLGLDNSLEEVDDAPLYLASLYHSSCPTNITISLDDSSDIEDDESEENDEIFGDAKGMVHTLKDLETVSVSVEESKLSLVESTPSSSPSFISDIPPPLSRHELPMYPLEFPTLEPDRTLVLEDNAMVKVHEFIHVDELEVDNFAIDEVLGDVNGFSIDIYYEKHPDSSPRIVGHVNLVPASFNYSRTFDRFKRALNFTLFMIVLPVTYCTFFTSVAVEFDKLLRALTCYDRSELAFRWSC